MKILPATKYPAPKFLLAAFVLLLAILTGCKKKEPQSTPIDPLVKKYFNYQPGTYWIYQDSLTGRVDSFLVVSNSTSTSSINGKLVDNIYMELESYSGNKLDTISMSVGLSENTVTIIYREILQPPISVGFSYPFNNLGSLIYFGYNRKLITLSEHAEVNNQIFDSVAQITQYDDPHTYKIVYDVCNTAGIIKMSIDHDSTGRKLELLRYQLIR